MSSGTKMFNRLVFTKTLFRQGKQRARQPIVTGNTEADLGDIKNRCRQAITLRVTQENFSLLLVLPMLKAYGSLLAIIAVSNELKHGHGVNSYAC